MASWTTITNAQVAAGAAVTTALMTALRDNPEGMGQRAAGAPKIFGVPYDYQEFLANGTWLKPSNAEVGDDAIIQIVAGGSAGVRGAAGGAGQGGSGVLWRVSLADLQASETVVVGAGAARNAAGGFGGDSSFGTSPSKSFIKVLSSARELRFYEDSADGDIGNINEFMQGGAATTAGRGATYGGAGGGIGSFASNIQPGISLFAGDGGRAYVSAAITDTDLDESDGRFPGGGGGGNDSDNVTGVSVAGAGGDGVVRVWCIKEG